MARQYYYVFFICYPAFFPRCCDMQGSSTGLILQGVAHAHSVLKESLSSPLLSLTFYFDFVFPNVKFYSNFYSWHHFAGDCAVCMHTKYSRSPCQVPPGASSYYAPLHQGTISLLTFFKCSILLLIFDLHFYILTLGLSLHMESL